MRSFSIVLVLMMLAFFSSGDSFAGNSRDLDQFANEVAANLVYRTDTTIAVRASDCRLRIEYRDLKVAFDLPLKGTTVKENDMEDSLVLSNAGMTRTIKDRQPESYEVLILRFTRRTMKQMLEGFERVIGSCGG